jgi:hypothetical protein
MKLIAEQGGVTPGSTMAFYLLFKINLFGLIGKIGTRSTHVHTPQSFDL